jgi:hypothetical protein
VEKQDSPNGERLWAFLEPDADSVERIKAMALRPDRPDGRAWRRLAVAVILVLAAALGVYSTWIRRPAAPETLVLEAEGDLMHVRAADGRQWLLGPMKLEEPPAGAVEMILEGDK